jgi:hypothetical protein
LKVDFELEPFQRDEIQRLLHSQTPSGTPTNTKTTEEDYPEKKRIYHKLVGQRSAITRSKTRSVKKNSLTSKYPQLSQKMQSKPYLKTSGIKNTC